MPHCNASTLRTGRALIRRVNPQKARDVLLFLRESQALFGGYSEPLLAPDTYEDNEGDQAGENYEKQQEAYYVQVLPHEMTDQDKDAGSEQRESSDIDL